MFIQCCVCLRVRKEGEWVVVEKPFEVMEHASHTYCPRCMKLAFKIPKECKA